MHQSVNRIAYSIEKVCIYDILDCNKKSNVIIVKWEPLVCFGLLVIKGDFMCFQQSAR